MLITIIQRAQDLYCKYCQALNYGRDPLLLFIRLYWGWQFFQTGKGKLINLERTTEFFTSLNIPMPMVNAIMAGATECLCGLALLLGLASRAVSLPLIGILCVAYLTADYDSLRQIFSNPDEFTSATPFLFLFVTGIVLVFGPGKLSLDYWLNDYLSKRRQKTQP